MARDWPSDVAYGRDRRMPRPLYSRRIGASQSKARTPHLIGGRLHSEDRIMAKTKPATAGAFLNDAREFYAGAETIIRSEPRRTRVVNALYFHTVELLLKAFLRAHNEEVWGHEIGKLYERCRSLGLKVKSDDRFNLGNVVS